jgi:hypothetical protein
MGRYDQCLVPLLEQVNEFGPTLGVEIARWFVEHQDPGS